MDFVEGAKGKARDVLGQISFLYFAENFDIRR
jgi:hypothetical protein